MMETILSEETTCSDKRTAIVEKFNILVGKVETKEQKEGMVRSLRAVSL